MENLRGWLNAGLGLLYPEACQLCGTAGAGHDEGYVCGSCRKAVQRIEPPFCARCGFPFQGAITTDFECSNCRGEDISFSYARSAAVARDNLLEIIHRYKYKRALWFEPFLAELLVEAAGSRLAAEGWDCLVPVPLHATKQREREFNQAERLAFALSRAIGTSVNTRLLRRVTATETQTRLTRQQRRENVRNAFALRGKPDVKGKRLVLIDDVFTTGATTGACARVLRRAGAAEVCVWTVARGI